MKKTTIAAVLAAAAFTGASHADAAIRITEWMYQGQPISGPLNEHEFVELTNVGAVAIDMSGYSYDDDSRLAGTFSLSGFGIVQPGESVIFTDTDAASFRANWNLSDSVKVIGNSAPGLGNGDEINIYSAGTLIDRLTYGSDPRTRYRSATLTTLDGLGANDVTKWAFTDTIFGGGVYDLSSVLPGGIQTSGHGETGNPGYFFTPVPEPTAVGLLAIGGLMALRRRRA